MLLVEARCAAARFGPCTTACALKQVHDLVSVFLFEAINERLLSKVVVGACDEVGV